MDPRQRSEARRADRRGTPQGVRGNPFPVPLGGGIGGRSPKATSHPKQKSLPGGEALLGVLRLYLLELVFGGLGTPMGATKMDTGPKRRLNKLEIGEKWLKMEQVFPPHSMKYPEGNSLPYLIDTLYVSRCFSSTILIGMVGT